jgi:hypothetical protein
MYLIDSLVFSESDDQHRRHLEGLQDLEGYSTHVIPPTRTTSLQHNFVDDCVPSGWRPCAGMCISPLVLWFPYFVSCKLAKSYAVWKVYVSLFGVRTIL